MQKEIVEVLTRVVVAFATFVGVAGTMAYYMREIRGITTTQIFLTILIYIVVGIILTIEIKNKIE